MTANLSGCNYVYNFTSQPAVVQTSQHTHTQTIFFGFYTKNKLLFKLFFPFVMPNKGGLGAAVKLFIVTVTAFLKGFDAVLVVGPETK